MPEGYIDKEFPKGTRLRKKTAKGYDGKALKRRERESAGGAHFLGPLTNPCIYDMSITTTNAVSNINTTTTTHCF